MSNYPKPGDVNGSFGSFSEKESPVGIEKVYLVIREPNHYDDSVDIYGSFVRLSDAQRTAADLNDKRAADEYAEPYTVQGLSVHEKYHAPIIPDSRPIVAPFFDADGSGKMQIGGDE